MISCAAVLCLTLWAGGCSKYSDLAEYQQPEQALSGTGLEGPQAVTPVHAIAVPPAGWKMEPLKSDDEHTHQVWLSPTGKTAYGIIHFDVPLWAFWVPPSAMIDPFVDAMKKSEGDATLIGKPLKDENLPGVRFVVEGGYYKMRINMIKKTPDGWVVYAGTLRGQPEVPTELELAERARDKTQVGDVVSGGASAGQPRPAAATRPVEAPAVSVTGRESAVSE